MPPPMTLIHLIAMRWNDFAPGSDIGTIMAYYPGVNDKQETGR